MYISNAIQEPGMKKFFSSEFGFLHALVADGRLWFNMTDLCNALRMALRDAKNECDLANCEVREYNVRRAKFTSCNCYVDEDGMHTIIVESRKTRANAYRQWIEAVVCFSLRNPKKSLALHEIELTGKETSYEVRKAYINQAKSNDALAKALIDKFVQEATAEESQNKPEQPVGNPNKLPKAKTKKASSTPKHTGKKIQRIQPKKFTPLHGHMTVEEFFRNEIPYAEFCYYLDGLLADAQAHIVLLDEKDQWKAQHRINVVSVFEKMLKANAGDIEYKPKDACV